LLTSTYRLPRAVRDRLTAALQSRRNRAACLTLATFLGRFWTAPKRLGRPFMLDRRALAPVEALGLTEARVRGAVRALEAAGFLERLPISGRTHQRTPDGLHRKPVAYRFARDYAEAFALANRRAEKARERRPGDRRCLGPAEPQRPPGAVLAARPYSPKWNPSDASRSIWARSEAPAPAGAPAPAVAEPNPRLEAALDRWGRALRERAGHVGPAP
jgi:hypothetical protein